MKRVVFIGVILCLLWRISPAQDSTHQWYVRANTHFGILLPEYGFMNYVADGYSVGGEINLVHQTTGKGIWERLYRHPMWGVSFYWSTMGNADVFGDQYSLYPYYSLHLVQRPKFVFGYQMGVGLSWATKKFDFTSNYTNLAIGSHLNIHYHADVLARYRLSERIWVNGGISFNHLSNANMSEPNVGLNFATLFAGVWYALGEEEKINRDEVPPYDPEWNYEVMLTGGLKHTRTFESFQYPALGLSFEVKRRMGYKFALGAGADFFYDSSVQPQMERLGRTFSSSDAYMTGIHFTQEFIYNRASLALQEGFYLGLTEKLNGYWMYNRAIARYKVTPHFFVNLCMKSHLYILDFPELGIGVYW